MEIGLKNQLHGGFLIVSRQMENHFKKTVAKKQYKRVSKEKKVFALKKEV